MRRGRSVRWALRSYRILLHALPRRVRGRHGEEIETLLADLLSEAYREAGVRGVVGVWLQSVLDLLVSGDAEGSPRSGLRRGRGFALGVDAVRQDARLAMRNLLSSPGTTLFAVGSLSVGMAVTVGVFTFADSILWKEWSFHEADRVVQVFERRDQYLLPAWPTFMAVEERIDLFDGVLASQLDLFALGTTGAARTVTGERISEDYFRVLGISAERGRYPSVGDHYDGTLPVVLSHHTWESDFGLASDIIGREIRLNGYPGRVVAVAPESFDGTKWGVSADLWVPTRAWAGADGWTGWEGDRALTVTVMARLTDGVDVEAANEALASLAFSLAEAQPGLYEGMRLEATDRLRGDMGPEIGVTADVIALVAILAGVLVLLVGCGNVASMLLARGVLRTKEIAVRYALGASRGRIVRQLLSEGFLLAAVAMAVGTLLSAYGTEWLVGLLPTFEFRVNFVTRPGPRSVALAGGLAVLTVVAAGLAPAFQLSRTDLAEAMKVDTRGGVSGSRARLLGAVTVGMVGGSVLALFLAGVFMRTLERSHSADPGFSTQERLMGVVPLRLAGHRWRDATALFENLEQRLEMLPGVASVGYGTGIPLGESWNTAEVYAGDRAYGAGDAGIRAFRSSVSDDYFRAMGTRIVRGRAFGPQDGAEGPWVAILNEELAERLWPGQDPLGRHVRFGLDGDAELVEVVGVAETGLYYMVGESPEPAVFASFRQWPQAQAMVVMEAHGDPLDLVPGFRAELARIDPDVPLQRVRSSEMHFRDAVWLQRLGASLGGTVSLLALFMASAGLYGVMAFTLGARRHEMGVRRVLGAQSTEVVKLAVRGALALSVAGLGVGITLSVVVGKALRVLLVGVDPWDPWVFLGTGAFVLGVGALAGLIPGIVASHVRPTSVLNADP